MPRLASCRAVEMKDWAQVINPQTIGPMMNKTITLSICVLLLGLSCERGTGVPAPSRQMTFTAVQEGVGTRTCIGDGAGTDKTVLWSTDDEISVVYQTVDGDAGCAKFTLSSGAGETEGTFTGTAGEALDNYWALYPHQSAARYSADGIANVSIPQIQMAAAGSFDPEAALLVAESEATDDVFSFKNVCSYAAVTPKFDCRSILVRSLTGEALACRGTLAPAARAFVPTGSSTADRVMLVGDIKAHTTYYIALLPQTLKGFYVGYFTEHAQIGGTNIEEFTLMRSQYHDISGSCPSTAPTTSRYVDLGLSVKWATMNLGAVAPMDLGLSFAWGETTPKYGCDWANYAFGDGSEHTSITSSFVTRYNGTDGEAALWPADDAAAAIWGSGWRLPTEAEVRELMDECEWAYDADRVAYKVTGKSEGYTDKCIYIPVDAVSGSKYWTASVASDSHYAVAHSLLLTPPDDDPSDDVSMRTDFRKDALLIRPVYGQ